MKSIWLSRELIPTLSIVKFIKFILRIDKITKEIEANNQKLTPEFLKYMSIIHLSNNTKFYFGESIPKYFLSNFDQNNAINNK